MWQTPFAGITRSPAKLAPVIDVLLLHVVLLAAAGDANANSAVQTTPTKTNSFIAPPCPRLSAPALPQLHAGDREPSESWDPDANHNRPAGERTTQRRPGSSKSSPGA